MNPGLPFHLILPLASGLVYVAAAMFLKRGIEGGADVWQIIVVASDRS